MHVALPCRLIRSLGRNLSEHLMYALMLMAHLTAPFDAATAAEMLNLAGREGAAQVLG